jgi:DNA-binding NarL/FixJ family response regulator
MHESDPVTTRSIALIADDHGLFRLGLSLTLRDQLGFGEVIETGSLDAALDALGEREEIGTALFDLSMPGMLGGASLAAVREIYPQLKLIVVSANDHRETILEALQAGVNGYIPKHLPDQAFVAALRTVLEGGIYVPQSLALESANRSVLPPIDALAVARRLTPRQLDVLRLLVAGKANKEIARALQLGEGTVKIHIAALFRTLAVHNRAGAVAAGLPLLPYLT